MPCSAAGVADNVPVVNKMGEDFEKEFNRELENYMIKMRHRSKGRDGNPNTRLHWSEHVGSFGLLGVLGVLLPSGSVLAASLLQMCEKNLEVEALKRQ